MPASSSAAVDDAEVHLNTMFSSLRMDDQVSATSASLPPYHARLSSESLAGTSSKVSEMWKPASAEFFDDASSDIKAATTHQNPPSLTEPDTWGLEPTRHIFIKNVQRDLSVDGLRESFKGYGSVYHIAAKSLRDKGCIRVSFYDLRDSVNAFNAIKRSSAKADGVRLEVSFVPSGDSMDELDALSGVILLRNVPTIGHGYAALEIILERIGGIRYIRSLSSEMPDIRIVEYYDIRLARQAIQSLDNCVIQGKTIRASFIETDSLYDGLNIKANGLGAAKDKFIGQNKSLASFNASDDYQVTESRFDDVRQSALQAHDIDYNASNSSGLLEDADLMSSGIRGGWGSTQNRTGVYSQHQQFVLNGFGDNSGFNMNGFCDADLAMSRRFGSVGASALSGLSGMSFSGNSAFAGSQGSLLTNGRRHTIPKGNELKLDRVLDGHDKRTTLMIRNIPNKYTQRMLIDFIDDTHKGEYDFLYLRIDFKNKCNVGYAFINFIDPVSIVSFTKRVAGKKWTKFNSDKICQLSYANIQGKQALIDKFRNSNVMEEDPSYRPKIFYSNGLLRGCEEPFPVSARSSPPYMDAPQSLYPRGLSPVAGVSGPLVSGISSIPMTNKSFMLGGPGVSQSSGPNLPHHSSQTNFSHHVNNHPLPGVNQSSHHIVPQENQFVPVYGPSGRQLPHAHFHAQHQRQPMNQFPVDNWRPNGAHVRPQVGLDDEFLSDLSVGGLVGHGASVAMSAGGNLFTSDEHLQSSSSKANFGPIARGSFSSGSSSVSSISSVSYVNGIAGSFRENRAMSLKSAESIP